MIPAPPVDGRRFESFFQELRRFAPYYTPDLNLTDEQGAGVALMKIFSQLAEIVALRLDQAPQKHFVAFLDKLGITLLPARPARVAVTFRLASGFEEAVRVPIGTRVTAPGVEDEIPFETTNELLAIPGVLTAAYGVDPLKDLIFSPPPNFLKQEARTPTELSYEIQSFVPADTNRLQLNHTTELEPGSFLRIGCKEKKVVQKVDEGNFVTLYEPVKENFAEGTIVLPIRNFEVFNGIDRQEHVLYIAHENLFTIKEEVEITLDIELKESEAPLQALDLDWQFWTKDEDNELDEEHWEPLGVKSDGTAGLSSSGRVVLLKKAKLEIKPRKVGGRESRWIRAELKDKLPVGAIVLPEIETIKASVNTQVDVNGNPIGIPADQGFYNATPLDVQVDTNIGFFPLGAEPRQFDQFYIASEEALSKREASIELKFAMDLPTLAEPSVILTDAVERSYSIGLRGRLYEFDIPTNRWEILGSPTDNQASTYAPVPNIAPSALLNGSEVYVFINSKETRLNQPDANKIWVNTHALGASTGTWTDLGSPDVSLKKIPFGPIAILTSGSPPSRVFVVGSDGKLYSRAHPGGATWDPHGSPGQDITLSSPPFVVLAGNKIFVFVNGGKPDDPIQSVYWLTLDPGFPAQWKSLKPKAGSFTAKYRPFAQPYVDSNGDDQAKVFTFAFLDPTDKSTGTLFETDTKDQANDEAPWTNWDQPTVGEVSADQTYAPHGYIENPAKPMDQEGKHIFLRGADGKLYERVDGKTAAEPKWIPRSGPDDPNLRDSPTVVVDSTNLALQKYQLIKVFAASGNNSLLRWVFEVRVDSVPATADGLAVPLNPATTSDLNNDPNYLGQNLIITGGPGSGQTRQITRYDGRQALALLDTKLNPLPDQNSDITIAGQNVGKARDGANHLLVIHDTPAPGAPTDAINAKAVYIRVNNTFHDVDSYSRVTGVVSIDPSNINPGDPYSLYSEWIDVTQEYLAPDDTGAVPQLSWEFWNGRGWLSIRNVQDSTRNLLTEGSVKFDLPKEIEATEVAGQENYWIRARLVSGDYGREIFRVEPTPPTQTVVSDKSSLRPPKVRQLLISYKAKPVAPDICLTFNNLDYVDQTAACEAPDSHFPPFETLEDQSFTIFFGFDKTFKTGPVQLLLDAAERNYDEAKPPEFAWSFRKDRKWKPLDAEDGSGAMMRQGILKLIASEELTRETRFGESLFWIKGSLGSDRALADIETEDGETLGPCGEAKETVKDPCAELRVDTEPSSEDSKHEAKCTCPDCGCLTQCSCDSTGQGEDPCAGPKNATQASKAIAATSADYPPPLLRGIFLNTVWAIHGETITEEIIGSGDGEPNQRHAFQQDDVLQDEDIRIQERLSAEERERIERELGKDSVVDREDLGGTWVRWKEVNALFDCGPKDSCYEIDRADGILRFGDGEHGRVVPAGVDNIRAFRYRTGGGAVGNVDTNEIEALSTAVAGIESVFNPAPAGGGSDEADTDAMLTIGPRRISHGDRAVSVEDFEELAYEASRQVAKVRCLSTTNLIRTGNGLPDPCDPRQSHEPLEERGWVSLIIVPDSPDPRPCPSLELRRAVKDYLVDRAPSVLAAGERIVVRPPDYVTVGINAKIFVSTIEKAATVENEARTRLEKFLHPVHGGSDGTGWEFGRPVTKSDVFALLERIPDIDRVENLLFQFGGQSNSDRVDIGPNQLLASGEHKLAIKKA